MMQGMPVPVRPISATASAVSPRRRLLAVWNSLNDDQRRALLAYAEALPRARPAAGPRPRGESVTAALRRLSRQYPAARARLLGRAADLVAGHILQQRDADEVIDELETLFARHHAQSPNPDRQPE